MPSPKKKFIDDITIVEQSFLNSIYGGLDGYSSDPTSPYAAGHLHDGYNTEWGHAPKIDLTSHITGRLTLPTPELKSIKLSATQAVPLTSSLFWTIPVPNDGYAASPKPMLLNIYWSANGGNSPGAVAFRVDWIYIQPGQNVIPPSVIGLGSSAWPANTVGASNPTPTTFRFKVPSGAAASKLYVNDSTTYGSFIQLAFPTSDATLDQFLLLGLEVSTAPTVTLSNPMAQVNIFAVEVLYSSSTLGLSNTSPTLISNDSGLADF